MKIRTKVPVCPECQSTNVMTNQSGERHCRRCGHSWQKEEARRERRRNTKAGSAVLD